MPYYVPLQGDIGGKRTLVLLDTLISAHKYSSYFNSLKAEDHVLTMASSSDGDFKLKKFNEYMYDNIIMLAPNADDFGKISFTDILEFVSNGGNLIVGASEDISDAQKAFLEGCGIKISSSSGSVIDHHEYIEPLDDDASHEVIKINSIALNDNKVITGTSIDSGIIYKGISVSIATPSNELAIKILQGNPSSFIDSNKNPGEPPLLVAAVQGRNNARVVVSGSLDMFSNKYLADSSTDNDKFTTSLSKWTFGSAGVLRFSNVTHFKSDGTPPDVILHEKERPDLPQSLYPDPEITRNSLVYRIKDEIVYSMIVEEYKDGMWMPYQANDMQMEFVMLDPYVRANMQADESGKFSCKFIAPDDYGIFKFRVLYRRPGYSTIHAETKVSLRPFKHDEYERFISSAFPYYISAGTMIGAFIVFSIFFLLTEDKKKESGDSSSSNNNKVKDE